MTLSYTYAHLSLSLSLPPSIAICSSSATVVEISWDTSRPLREKGTFPQNIHTITYLQHPTTINQQGSAMVTVIIVHIQVALAATRVKPQSCAAAATKVSSANI